MTKRLPLIVAALVACLALGTVGASAKDTKIGSTITVKYKGAKAGDPYGTSAFSGKVGPRACAADRTVKIKGIGSDTTDDGGKYSIGTSGTVSGKYKVVAQESETKGGDTCKKVKAVIKIKKTG